MKGILQQMHEASPTESTVNTSMADAMREAVFATDHKVKEEWAPLWYAPIGWLKFSRKTGELRVMQEDQTHREATPEELALWRDFQAKLRG